jgi:hypothetical protein
MKYLKAQFTISTEHKSFCCEASDLQNWDHAYPITIVSDMGCEATFRLVGMTRSADEDNELLEWVYGPTAESLKAHPRLDGWKVVILND